MNADLPTTAGATGAVLTISALAVLLALSLVGILLVALRLRTARERVAALESELDDLIDAGPGSRPFPARCRRQSAR